MADLKHLPAGAYLIRNKKTEFVIEFCGDEPGCDAITPQFAYQDPLHRREQQIWWTETLPGFGKNKTDEDAIYSISNIRWERLLGMYKSSIFSNVDPVVTSASGHPSEKWSIERVEEDKEGEFYKIINVGSGVALGFVDEEYPDIGSCCPVSAPAAAETGQYWEFVIPNVQVPPGWIQIRNVSADGPLLEHKYLTCPPFLEPKAPTSTASNDRINWGSQWTFLLPNNHEGGDPQTFWLIKNRLTQGVLYAHTAWSENGRDITVSAAHPKYGCDQDIWKPEIYRDGSWVLVNKSSSIVLEKGVDMDVQCKVKDTTGRDDRRKWEFVEYNKTVG